MIRPSRPEEAERQREIERAAGVRFGDVGMPEIAAAEPMEASRLAAYASDGRSWVAVDQDDTVVGYVVVDVVDAAAHIEQISVEPQHQGHGIGRALIDHVAAWARSRGLSALTLTTFSDVPWNRPLYEHLGFRALDEGELSPALRAIRDHEAALGLDPSIRVCMRRDL